MKKIALLFGIFASVSALAGTTVQQSGTVTPGHATTWTTTGIIQDGGSATNGFMTNLGLFANGGQPDCITASTTARASFSPASSPYSQFCLFTLMGGRSGVSLNSYNGAANANFVFNINGQDISFPGPGGGNVIGPVSSTQGDVAVFNDGGGTILADGGPAAFAVATITALKAVPVTTRLAGFAVATRGYYAAGDGGASLYKLQVSACSPVQGDGGAQVASNTAGNCWIIAPQPAYSPKQWGSADGSATNSITGSVSSSSAAVTLSAAGDFVNGQPVALVGAGATYTQAAPTGLAAAARGSASTAASYTYTVASIDSALGVGIALASTSVSNAAVLGTPLAIDAATLIAPFSFNGQISGTTLTVNSTTGTMAIGQKVWGVHADVAYSTRITAFIGGVGGNGTYRVASGDPLVSTQTVNAETMYAAVPGVYNEVSWTAPGSPPVAYAVYEGANSGSMTCVAIVAAGSPNGTKWKDYGANHRPGCPTWVPSAPLAQAQNDVLKTTISSGGGTTAIVLASTAAHTAASTMFFHDSTASIQALAALGLPMGSDCAQYNTIAGGISLVGAGFTGGGQNCTRLRNFGGGNTVTQAASNTYLAQMSLDEAQSVAGFAISVTGTRTRDRDIFINNAYSMVEVANNGASTLNNFFENILNATGQLRGDYGFYLHTDGTHAIQNVMFYNISTAGTTTAYSFLQDGAVNGTRGRLVDTQAGPHEFIVQNSVGDAVGSDFGMFDDSGTNFAWDDNIALLNSAQGYIFKRFYCQGQAGGMAPCFYVGPSVGPVSFSVGMEVFSADLDGIEWHGQNANSDSTLMISSNSQAGAGIGSKVHVAANAVDGATFLLAAGDRYSGASTQPTEAYGINIESGYNGGVFRATPLIITSTVGAGTLGSVCDNTGVYGMVQVDGVLNIQSCTNAIVSSATGVTYTAAQFVPGVTSLPAIVVRSGQSSGVTDTTPTAALINAQIPGVAVGDVFYFRTKNQDTHAVTLAAGTGVTVGGTVNTVGLSIHNYRCRVTGIGGSAAVTCTGSSTGF